MLLRSRRTKRGGIMNELHLSMRVLSVVPRHAVTVGSLKGGTVIGKTPEERGKLHLGIQTSTPCRAVHSKKIYIRTLPIRSVLIKGMCGLFKSLLRYFSKSFDIGVRIC